MNVKVNQPQPQTQKQTPNQTNPLNNLNLQPQLQINQNVVELLQQLLEKVTNTRQQIQQQLNSQGLYPQSQQNNLSLSNNNGEFIVKANMKASYIALRLEQVLMSRKKVTLSGLGYAIPSLLDAVMLIRKDLEKQGIYVNISIELFEKEVVSAKVGAKKSIVTGLRATLTI
jgi:hypothetical protein